ncbi:LysR family transcriptional regulator [Raoultibacter massiliensis]|uniref:LysR family transcriptional regulator n=1 Tax=Raoultibacter massiliensis TaxID=1852371 RepID=A0ABV1JEU7_9ACTN|nr:LysR family transcriptional regulator [Raoultibacter massiliensis]
MVNLPQLREFVTFAKYLNISKAADVLFTSQSNLSKHLKQLEGDLGFNLTCKKGNRIYLTDEGSHFLSGIQSVLCDYDQLVEECQLIQKNEFAKLTLQDPPFSDRACAAFYELVNNIRRASKTVSIDFVHEKFRDRPALLMSDEMHLLLEYHCDDIENIVEQYAQQHILAVQISIEPLAVWGKRFVLEGVDKLDPMRFKELSIMQSSDASSPMNTLISELPAILGYSPKIFVSPARSAAQYYYSGHKNSVFLLPQSYTTKEVFTSRNDMRAVPIADDSIPCRGVALINMRGAYYSFLEPLVKTAEVS